MKEENTEPQHGEQISPAFFNGARILAQSRVGPAELFLLMKEDKIYLLQDPDTENPESHREAKLISEDQDPFEIFVRDQAALLALSKGLLAMFKLAEVADLKERMQ